MTELPENLRIVPLDGTPEMQLKLMSYRNMLVTVDRWIEDARKRRDDTRVEELLSFKDDLQTWIDELEAKIKG